jgi:hypothetical protein
VKKPGRAAGAFTVIAIVLGLLVPQPLVAVTLKVPEVAEAE